MTSVKTVLSLVAILIGSVLTNSVAAQTTPSLAGCPVLPADNVWNTRVDHLPVDRNSPGYIATIGPNTGVHPDFGAATWEGGPIGIPYNLVPGNNPRVNVFFEYADESDPGPYPIPADAAIEGGSNSTGDRHVLVLDRQKCLLYELFSSYRQSDGSWQAGSGAIFDLRSHGLRPRGWTSADAAGLPILPGLVRYDEVAAGEIRHALRFTAPKTQKAFVWPARHYASSLISSNYPPMGKRFRLRASFDVSLFSPDVQVILRALKRYGMILADNGSAWYISGAPDPHWNDDVLVNELRRVKGTDFEAVDETLLIINLDSGQARQPLTGRTDLLWQHGTTGAVIVWYLDGTTLLNSAYLYQGGLPDWKVVGSGDFNGDGRTDLLWQHGTTGAVIVWYLDGTTLLNSAYLYQGGLPDWKVVGGADFNGDGKADLLWQNQTTGAVIVWYMNGSTVLGSPYLYQGGLPDWKVVGPK